MRVLPAALLATALLPLATLACGGGGGGGSSSGGNTGGGGGAILHPSWSRDVLPALQASCGSAGNAGCHGTTTAQGRIVYYFTEGRTAQSIYDSLINKPSSAPGWVYIKPGTPSQSWIYEKVTSTNPGGGGFGSPMPLAGTFGASNIETLRNWIQDGALNN